MLSCPNLLVFSGSAHSNDDGVTTLSMALMMDGEQFPKSDFERN